MHIGHFGIKVIHVDFKLNLVSLLSMQVVYFNDAFLQPLSIDISNPLSFLNLGELSLESDVMVYKLLYMLSSELIKLRESRSEVLHGCVQRILSFFNVPLEPLFHLLASLHQRLLDLFKLVNS